MSPDEQALVQAALVRGYLTNHQLAEAAHKERALAAQGQSRGLLPLLASEGYLTHAQVAELRSLHHQTVADRARSSGRISASHVSYDAATRDGAVDPSRALSESGEGAGWEPGARLGDYILRTKLGQGGMGVVYLAEHLESGQQVAVKALSMDADDNLIARFEREGQAQAAVDRHPNVIRIHSAGQAWGHLYLVMDLATGGDLKDRLKQGRLGLSEACALMEPLLRGMAHVHRQGILHRDLKPANIMFDEAGVPKLADFGLARIAGEQGLTATGATLGTPAYMSPEQAGGEKHLIDLRTDVYGMGAVLYTALTGSAPFSGGAHSVITKVLTEDPPRPTSLVKDLPLDAEHVILKAMAKERFDRYGDCDAFADDVARLARGEPVEAGPPRKRARPKWQKRAAVALVGLGLLAAGAVGFAVRARGGDDGRERRGRLELTVSPLPAVIHQAELVIRGEATGAERVVVTVQGKQQVLEPGPFEWSLDLSGVPCGSIEVSITAYSVVRRTRPYEATVAWRGELPDGPDLVYRPETDDYLWRRHGLDLLLVYVPAGTFIMGGGAPDEGGEDLEVRPVPASPTARPAHRVRITAPFLMGKYEVTRAQYARFCAADPEVEFPPNQYPVAKPERADDCAVTQVTWREATAFCAWAGLALPTEAQWEYAARGTDARPWPWGDHPEPSPAIADIVDGRLEPVGSFEAGRSPFGAYDMAGGVFEWVQDVRVGYALAARYVTVEDGVWIDPVVRADVMVAEGLIVRTDGDRMLRATVENAPHVDRGGGPGKQFQKFHSGYREEDPPNTRLDNTGFRAAYPLAAR